MHTGSIEPNRPTLFTDWPRQAFIICLAVLGFAACSTPASPSQIEAATLHLDSQQCIGRTTNQATAVVVAGNLVVSVAHPFVETKSFELRDNTGQEVEAVLIYLDPERDLAVLRITDDTNSGGVSTSDSEPRKGLRFGEPHEEVDVRYVTFANGDPDIGPTIIDATILRYTRLTLDGAGDRAGIELRAPIESGDSGGPVLNSDGEILGLVFATAKGSDTGWAIASEEVVAAIKRAEGHDPIPLVCTD